MHIARDASPFAEETLRIGGKTQEMSLFLLAEVDKFRTNVNALLLPALLISRALLKYIFKDVFIEHCLEDNAEQNLKVKIDMFLSLKRSSTTLYLLFPK